MTLIEQRLRELYPERYKDKIFNEDTFKWESKPVEVIIEEVIVEEEAMEDIPHKRKRKPRNRASKDIRLAAKERDNFKCSNCGSASNLHVHHKVYRAFGGTHELDNLVTLCAACHAEVHKGEPIYKLMIKQLV